MVQDVQHQYFFRLEGRVVSIKFRRNPRAKKIVLRLLRARKVEEEDGIVVTLPLGLNKKDGIRFAEEKKSWIAQNISKLPSLIIFEDGALVPYMGIEHKIVHQPNIKHGVWRDDAFIYVSGRREFLGRRLKNWFKREAYKIITTYVIDKTRLTNKRVGKISIRDTRSRWGSCSSSSNLSFSWRLIMAPEFVLDYVVAHEVAHTLEHNHSANFWKLTRELCGDMEKAKAWLKNYGELLHRYI